MIIIMITRNNNMKLIIDKTMIRNKIIIIEYQVRPHQCEGGSWWQSWEFQSVAARSAGGSNNNTKNNNNSGQTTTIIGSTHWTIFQISPLLSRALEGWLRSLLDWRPATRGLIHDIFSFKRIWLLKETPLILESVFHLKILPLMWSSRKRHGGKCYCIHPAEQHSLNKKVKKI